MAPVLVEPDLLTVAQVLALERFSSAWWQAKQARACCSQSAERACSGCPGGGCMENTGRIEAVTGTARGMA